MSQYNVLPEFINELKLGFEQRGINCIESKAITDELIKSIGGKADAIISLNGGCSDLVMQGYLKDFAEIPFFSYLFKEVFLYFFQAHILQVTLFWMVLRRGYAKMKRVYMI